MQANSAHAVTFFPSASRLAFLFILAAASMNCEGPAGPAGPTLKGDVVGYCYLLDPSGYNLDDQSGVTVSAEGTIYKAVTNADGLFRLQNLTTGTYVLRYEKPGYGTYRRQGFQFVGGSSILAEEVSLYGLPQFSVINLSANNAGGSVNITATLTGSTGSNRNIIIFFGASASISSDPVSYSSYTYAYVSSGSSTMLAIISGSSLHSWGFTPGQTVYLVAYGVNGSGYRDLSTMKYIFPSISATSSNVIGVTVP